MYAIVKTGGKQYRVTQDETLLVERLPAEEGATIALQPLLLVDGERLVDGDGLADVAVQARVVAHERGPKLRVVKFKPKRGYKRRTGHRQELTRIQITSLGGAPAKPARARRAKATAPAGEAAAKPAGDASTPTPEAQGASDGA